MHENYKTLVFSYFHDGSMWELEIKARDAEDAKARVAKLAYATFDGEQIASIPASSQCVERAPVGLASKLDALSVETMVLH